MTTAIKYCFILAAIVQLQIKNCNTETPITQDIDQYIDWVEDPVNGLYQSKTFNGVLFSVQYKPLEYDVLLQEKRKLSQNELEAETDSISGMQYYTLRIATISGSDIQRFGISNDDEYYARLEYFSLEMQNDISLIQGNDTLPCRMFHFERTYGIDPRATFVLAFENGKSKLEDRTLILNDRVFKNGPVLMTIESSNIERTPKLNLPE